MAVDLVKGFVAGTATLVQYTYVLNNPLKYVDPTGLLPSNDILNLIAGNYTRKIISSEVMAAQVLATVITLDSMQKAIHKIAQVLTYERLAYMGFLNLIIEYQLDTKTKDSRGRSIYVHADVVGMFGVGGCYTIVEVKPYYTAMSGDVTANGVRQLDYYMRLYCMQHDDRRVELRNVEPTNEVNIYKDKWTRVTMQILPVRPGVVGYRTFVYKTRGLQQRKECKSFQELYNELRPILESHEQYYNNNYSLDIAYSLGAELGVTMIGLQVAVVGGIALTAATGGIFTAVPAGAKPVVGLTANNIAEFSKYLANNALTASGAAAAAASIIYIHNEELYLHSAYLTKSANVLIAVPGNGGTYTFYKPFF